MNPFKARFVDTLLFASLVSSGVMCLVGLLGLVCLGSWLHFSAGFSMLALNVLLVNLDKNL